MRYAPRMIAAVCLVASLLVWGCGPTLIREPVFQSEAVRVEIRRMDDDGTIVPRGYAHPITISDVRLVHIFSTLAYEDEDGKRQPAIRLEHLYDLGQGVARALKQAGPDDEVVAAAFSRDPRLGIFTDDKVTAFQIYAQEPVLVIRFFAIEESLEEPGVTDESSTYEIPMRVPDRTPPFRVIAAEAQASQDARTLDIDWRDPSFRRAISLSTRGGTLRRKTILMQLPEEEVVPEAETHHGVPTGEMIRALDVLDAERQAGSISESEYKRKRRLILEGKLEEAGDPSEPR